MSEAADGNKLFVIILDHAELVDDLMTGFLDLGVRGATVIESRGALAFDSFGDLRRALRTEAAALGGDAVILGEERTDERIILTGTAMIKSDRKKLRGEVVVFWRVDGWRMQYRISTRGMSKVEGG